MLDCFCGLGGASEGFHQEGFECTGIDIVDVGYPYKLILADMRELDGKDFRGYDVVWGSPPCRDFSVVGKVFGHTWKRPPDPKGNGMELVNAYLEFVKTAEPKIWIMENVPNLQKYYEPSVFQTNLGDKHMARCFWGNFPTFLLPKSKFKVVYPGVWRKGERDSKKERSLGEGRIFNIQGKLRKWYRAKIPLACSLAFARACKTQLLEA